MEKVKTDYLVIGCGAVAMSFVDTMLDESDASFIIVDNHHAPGGHWNDDIHLFDCISLLISMGSHRPHSATNKKIPWVPMLVITNLPVVRKYKAILNR